MMYEKLHYTLSTYAWILRRCHTLRTPEAYAAWLGQDEFLRRTIPNERQLWYTTMQLSSILLDTGNIFGLRGSRCKVGQLVSPSSPASPGGPGSSPRLERGREAM